MKKKKIKTRDHLLVKIINGATKAAIHIDRRKEKNKKECRKKIKTEET